MAFVNNIIGNFAKNILQQHPELTQNQNDKSLIGAGIQAILNGDAETGAKIANNLCQTYGTNAQDAYKQASNFFGLK